jgi:acetyl esterase/lipase
MAVSTDPVVQAKREGRLADPDRDLRSDPRTDPRLLAALAAFGLDAPAAPPPLDRSAGQTAIAEFVGGAEAAFEGLYAALPNDLPGDDEQAVHHTTETLRGPTGDDIVLHIARPVGLDGPLPCTVYVHGGGMTILSTDNKVHRQWRTDLAAAGMVAIGLDFRNAWTAAGLNPFPAGLDDCSAAVAWISEHRTRLGISSLVLQGESGGANLVLATALKALRDGRSDVVDGVYATVPYISGGYGWSQERKLAELPSLYENEGYFLNTAMMDLLVAVYDPTGDNAENPLCWPYFATVEDVRGLPPHVIAVNELDPLRDEGVAYYRRLLAAGVRVTGRVNLGITHGADMIFRQAIPDVYRSAIADIKRFAETL